MRRIIFCDRHGSEFLADDCGIELVEEMEGLVFPAGVRRARQILMLAITTTLYPFFQKRVDVVGARTGVQPPEGSPDRLAGRLFVVTFGGHTRV